MNNQLEMFFLSRIDSITRKSSGFNYYNDLTNIDKSTPSSSAECLDRF